MTYDLNPEPPRRKRPRRKKKVAQKPPPSGHFYHDWPAAKKINAVIALVGPLSLSALFSWIASQDHATFGECITVFAVACLALWGCAATMFAWQFYPAYHETIKQCVVAAIFFSLIGMGVFIGFSYSKRTAGVREAIAERDVNSEALISFATDFFASVKQQEKLSNRKAQWLQGSLLIVQRPPETTEWEISPINDQLPEKMQASSPSSTKYIGYLESTGKYRSSNQVYETKTGEGGYYETDIVRLRIYDIATGQLAHLEEDGYLYPPDSIVIYGDASVKDLVRSENGKYIGFNFRTSVERYVRESVLPRLVDHVWHND